MAAAFSIISLVIFFTPCACACAHNAPGKSVPAKPIPENVFMKFRGSSILTLLFAQSPRRARKISQHALGRFPAFLVPEDARRQSSSDGPRFFFPERK